MYTGLDKPSVAVQLHLINISYLYSTARAIRHAATQREGDGEL